MSRMIYTECGKWEDYWFHRLSVKGKLLFLYCVEHADHAGFLEWDPERACYETGISKRAIEKVFKEIAKCYEMCGSWIWVKNYLKYQRNLPLTPTNNAHKNILRIIEGQKHRFPNILDRLNNGGPMEGLRLGAGEGLKTELEGPCKVVSNKVKYSNSQGIPLLPPSVNPSEENSNLVGEEIAVVADAEVPF